VNWLEEIRKRLEAATPGPWNPHQGEWVPVAFSVARKHNVPTLPGMVFTSEDSAFIAHARTDIEKLLLIVEAERESKRKEECLMSGHRFEVVASLTREGPHSVICLNCGMSWGIVFSHAESATADDSQKVKP
jgi:hypothetical protein